ncbi:hypothetical protein R1sor_002254 [Riccia sorocarpa]|uniref:Uncharacterized protein n=1 Tax=Riccia sorocarpa TaxID=122646 RepID=A0ABD3H1C6_9MARC
MELVVEAFLEEKNKPDTRPWETTVSEMSQRLARFLEEVPMKWGQMYEEWLKSKEFKDWIEEVEEWVDPPGYVGIVDEELAEVLGHHEVVHYALKVMHRQAGDKKVHEKCIREMMAIPESHPAIIRPIGLNKDKKKPMLLFPIWNGRTIEMCMNLEKSTRGRISSEGIRLRSNETV